jgi:hypothetical protein
MEKSPVHEKQHRAEKGFKSCSKGKKTMLQSQECWKKMTAEEISKKGKPA